MHIFSLILITTLGDRESDEEIDFREIQHHFTDEETGTQKGAVLKSSGTHGGIGSHVSLAQTYCPQKKKKKKSYLSFSFFFTSRNVITISNL